MALSLYSFIKIPNCGIGDTEVVNNNNYLKKWLGFNDRYFGDCFYLSGCRLKYYRFIYFYGMGDI